MINNYITVSQLNSYIKQLLEIDQNTKNITVKGEITNLSLSNGHYYFSLKDDTSSIRAVIFSSYRNRMSYEPKNGDEVFVYGSINVYAKNGTYQIVVQDIMVNGDGTYLLKVEELRKKLESEGLFSLEHKKKIPNYPQSIGVITAKTGAAIHDITRNIIARYPLADIKYFDSAVQGKNALSTLLNALNSAIKENVSVIIIGRGGGDKEDLSVFNEETLVRAIYNCPIPLISAVGHESDTTLIDYVSDVRAATPTEAAVRATPNIVDIMQDIASMEEKISRYTKNYLENKDTMIGSMIRFLVAKSPLNYLNSQKESVKTLKEKIYKSLGYSIKISQNEVEKYNLIINSSIKRYLDNCKSELNKTINRLELLNPMNIISRGYSLTYSEDSRLIDDISKVREEEIMKTIVKNGIIISKVMRKGDNNG